MGDVLFFPVQKTPNPADQIIPCGVCDNDEWLYRADNRLECAACGTELDGMVVQQQQPQEA